MGATTSMTTGVKYGDTCYEVEPNDHSFHIVILYPTFLFLLISGGLFFSGFKPLWWIVPLILGIFFALTYLFYVYNRHTKIKNSPKIECKDSFRTYSIW